MSHLPNGRSKQTSYNFPSTAPTNTSYTLTHTHTNHSSRHSKPHLNGTTLSPQHHAGRSHRDPRQKGDRSPPFYLRQRAALDRLIEEERQEAQRAQGLLKERLEAEKARENDAQSQEIP